MDSVRKRVLESIDTDELIKPILPLQAPIGSRKERMIERATILHLHESEDPEPKVGLGCAYSQFIELCPSINEVLKMRNSKC